MYGGAFSWAELGIGVDRSWASAPRAGWERGACVKGEVVGTPCDAGSAIWTKLCGRRVVRLDVWKMLVNPHKVKKYHESHRSAIPTGAQSILAITPLLQPTSLERFL